MWSRVTAPGFVILMVLSVASAAGQGRTNYDEARKQLVRDVILGSGIDQPRIVEAMLQTPRHEFVAPQYRHQAYYDMALPIGSGQTISSPYIVAVMTQALDPQATDRVLEVGTGSGYQAAVLSPLVKEVFTIEIVAALGEQAQRTLQRLKYKNVFVKVGDGYLGWPDRAPFDKIVVTCSPESVPHPLVDQLREGGLLVIPVGERYQQTLYLMRKKEGKLVSEALQPTLFVPMTGKAEEGRQVQPDPLRPKVVNGDFESPPPVHGFLPGWYYERLAMLESGDAPQGAQYLKLANSDLGRPAHVLQGLAVDGRHIQGLKLTGWVKLENVRDSGQPLDVATIAITFYDQNRKDLGFLSMGPLRGTHDWKQVEFTYRVPPQAREALLRVGLFGATGEAYFDDLQLTPVYEKK